MRFYSWAVKTASSLNYGSDASFAAPPKYSSAVKYPALSQIDCLTPRQVDLQRDRERHDRIKELQVKGQGDSSSYKPVAATHAYHHIRNPDKTTSLPGISQVPLGGREPAVSRTQPKEPVKLPSISQISCLGGKTSPKERYSTRKFLTSDTDSEFVKLSKAGGHSGLLHYVEAKSILDGASRCDVSNAPSALRSTVRMDLSSDMEPGWKPSSWSSISDRKQRVRQGEH